MPESESLSAEQEISQFWDTLEEKSYEIPDSPTEPSPAPSSEPTPGVDRGDGRDSLGKFAAKAAEPKDAVPQDPAPKVADQAPPEPPATPANADPAAHGSPEGAPDQPFQVRVDGRDVPFDWVRVTPNGLTVPLDKQQDLHTIFGQALAFRNKREETQQALDDARQFQRRLQFEADLNKQAHGRMADEFARQLEIANLPLNTEQDQQAFLEKAVAYFAELRQAIPSLQREAELSKREADLRMREFLNQPSPEQVQEVRQERIALTVDDHITSAKSHPDLKDLTDADWQWLHQRVLQYPQLFVYRAGEKLSPEEQAAGVTPGEDVWHEPSWGKLVTERLEYRREILGAHKAAQDAAERAKQNAARQAAPQAPPPPGATPPTTTKPGDTPTGSRFKNAAEWMEWAST